MGYEKNLVVLTRPRGYIKKPENNLLANLYYRKYPAFVTALRNRYAVYNRTLKYIEQQENQGNILVLRPSESIRVGRMEQDPERLKQMYELGKNDAGQMLDAIASFLSK